MHRFPRLYFSPPTDDGAEVADNPAETEDSGGEAEDYGTAPASWGGDTEFQEELRAIQDDQAEEEGETPDQEDEVPQPADETEETSPEEEVEAEEEEETAAEAAEEVDETDTDDESEETETSEFVERFRDTYPDAVVEDEEDVLAHVNELRKVANQVQPIADLWNDHPEFQAVFNEVVDGADFVEAVARHVDGVDVEMPDPNIEPERYAEWKAERKVQEKMAELQGEEQDDGSEDLREQAEENWQQQQRRLKREMDMDDEEVQKVTKKLATHLFGDPMTGQMPSDTLMVFAQGLRYEQAIEKAKEEAYKEGKNDGIQESQGKATQSGDGLPKFSKGGAGGDEAPNEPQTREQKKLQMLDKKWENGDSWRKNAVNS